MKATIGPYRILEALGQGGMGVVYRGVHDNLARDVAVKALAPELTQQPQFRDRFFSEARTQARLLHPNIVAIYDLLEEDGDYFIVMEFFAGEGLDTILAQRGGSAFEEGPALRLLAQVLAALDSAHSQGVIHRDVKPSNVLVNDRGLAKLMDFGIALLVGDKRLTQSSQTIGTPVYMSPEQILRPREVDHRTDIYSSGVVLYEMLAGVPPFDAETEYEIKKQHIETPAMEIDRLQPELSAVLVKALAKAPDDRFSSAREFIRALQAAAPAAFADDDAPAAAVTIAAAPPPPPATAATRITPPLPPPAAPATGASLKKYWPIGAALAAAVVLAAIVLAIFSRKPEAEPPPIVAHNEIEDPATDPQLPLVTTLPTPPPPSPPPPSPPAPSPAPPSATPLLTTQPQAPPKEILKPPPPPPPAPVPASAPPPPAPAPQPQPPPPPISPPPPPPVSQPPPPPPPPKKGVTLYEHGSFQGRSETLYGDDRSLRDNRIGNDAASSIRVDPGCVAILYRDIDYGGKYMEVSSSLAAIRRPVGNDEVSSIKVFCR